jgi:ribosomal protein S12 methylthiotransferase accessory factor
VSYRKFDAYEFKKNCSFSSLVDPIGGVVGNIIGIETKELGVPSYHRILAGLGDLSISYPWLRKTGGQTIGNGTVGGAGSGNNAEISCLRAVAEAAERYATAVYCEEEVRTASASELGDEALDYRRWPKCSTEEYANPHCPLKPFNPNKPIRWIQGYSVTSQKPMWVPLAMSHILFEQKPEEMFWLPITTGVAAHTNIAQAAVSAICELIERDAIALTWLAKLAHSQMTFDTPIPEPFIKDFNALNQLPLRQHFFDATSDFGVPIVYSIQFMDGHPSIANFVGCSVDFSPWSACAKVIREAANGRTGLEQNRTLPDHTDLFYSLEDGAVYMGQENKRPAFDFLFSNETTKNISQMTSPVYGGAEEQLNWLIARFKSLGFELVLVDLTTDDLRESGLEVIRAICPDLMPLDFAPAARYKGHARLHDYPIKAGFGARAPKDFNIFPQPFA